MRIALIYDNITERATGNYVALVLDKLGIEYDHFWTRDSAKIPDKYDLYFRVDEGMYEYDIPSYLKPSAYWALDTHLRYPLKRIKEISDNYDFVFCPQKSDIKRLQSPARKVMWVPVCCDPDIHARINMERDYDVGFVGTDGGVPRKFYLQELRERYPSSFIGPLDHREMGAVYSRSKIGFQYILCHYTGRAAITMRIFEIASSAAMILTNEGETEALNDMGFRDRENIVIYKNAREMFSLIEYYLKNDEERAAIAESGFRLVREKHTYLHRVVQMLDFIKENI